MIALLAITALLLALSGCYELLRGRRGALEQLVRHASGIELRWGEQTKSLGAILNSLGTEQRLRRSGLGPRLPLPQLMIAKSFLLLTGLVFVSSILSSSPGRLMSAAALVMPVALFLLPDVMLEMAFRRRLRSIKQGLSDALDLAANGIGAGQDPLNALASASPADAPLGLELRALAAVRRCGATRREALAEMRERVPTHEIANLSAAVERSSRFGSPLAERLREHAVELRRSQMRAIAEHAARSSPRIQLVVALLLVPSVLLMIAAGLLANLGSFTSGL